MDELSKQGVPDGFGSGVPTCPTRRSKRVEMLDPSSRGIRGNSHMIMQDNNNLQIADFILRSIDERVGKSRGQVARVILRS